MTLGEKILELRRRNAISQDALAERLDVSRQAVSKWERDEAIPETDKIVKLAQVFGVTTDYLLLDSVQEPGSSPRTMPASPLLRWLCFFGIGLAAAGTLLTLLGILAVTLWAVQTDQWFTDYGRFGTALFFNWPGAVLLGGVMLLLLALALLALRALLSKKSS